MPIVDISHLLDDVAATSAGLDALSAPIGINLLAYASDLGEFRLGDGIRQFSDLPTYASIADESDLITTGNIISKFPILTPEDGGKLVLISQSGDQFEYSTISLNDIATTEELTAILAGKSPSVHTHDHLATSAELTAVEGMVGLSFDDQDLISMMLLETMQLGDLADMATASGYADEFKDDTGILSTNFMLVSGAYVAQKTGSDQITSIVMATDTPITVYRIFARIETAATFGVDYVFETSRDGGSNWVQASVQSSTLSTSNIQVVVGDCAYGAPIDEGNQAMWRLRSLTNKDITLHGVRTLWSD